MYRKGGITMIDISNIHSLVSDPLFSKRCFKVRAYSSTSIYGVRIKYNSNLSFNIEGYAHYFEGGASYILYPLIGENQFIVSDIGLTIYPPYRIINTENLGHNFLVFHKLILSDDEFHALPQWFRDEYEEYIIT